MAPLALVVKWQCRELEVALADSATVRELKAQLQALTRVAPARQKLLGLKRSDGRPAGDEDVVAELKLGANLMLMGTPDDVIDQVVRAGQAQPQVKDDFAIGVQGGGDGAAAAVGQPIHIKTHAEWLAKMEVKGQVYVVDFFAEWCGPCKMIAPKFKEFAALFPTIVFLKIDVDEVEEVAASAGISAMPTFQVYKDGKVIENMVGASDVKLKAMIEKYA